MSAGKTRLLTVRLESMQWKAAITQEPLMRLTVLWDSALGKSQRTN